MKFEIHQPNEEPKKFEIQEQPKKKFVVENPGEIYMNDLYCVGPEKPMGYLPLNTLEKFSDKNEEELIAYLKTKNIETKSFGPEAPSWHGPSLYAFHRKSLQGLLDENNSILIANAWPTNVDEFVEKCNGHLVLEPGPLQDIIIQAFGNKKVE